jgi:peptidoglycan/xylan/chitin deacetylase (PgdA/CDA1 family)
MSVVPIFLYHQIDQLPPEKNPIGMATAPHHFEAQMRYLHENGYRSIALKELLDAYHTKRTFAPKTFVITFDDGYLDNYATAFPIMQQYGFTATIFLVADLVGKHTDWEGQREPYTLMSWQHVDEMRRHGFDFGSHTRTHINLKKADVAIAKNEIVTSRQIIQDKTGASVYALAYPYEAFYPQHCQMVQEAGYLGACGSPAEAESPYNLWREECFGYETMAQFQRKVAPWHNIWMWTRHRSPMIRGLKIIKRAIKA